MASGTRKTSQVVQVVSGGVIDEISRVFLGRVPEAKDGTYLWEVEGSGESRLIPIATDFGKTVHIGEKGFQECLATTR